MLFGQSKDFGTCKSIKKNGEKCTAFVNTNRCEYCIYHVKQEYQKCSKRSELQSSFAGRGLVALRNKVLGKNEVFYAGKSYTAIPASKSKKLAKKDENRLQLLSGMGSSVSKKKVSEIKLKKHAAQVEAARNQRKRDLEILQKLGGLNENKSNSDFTAEAHSSTVTLEESKKTVLDVISKLKAKQKVTEIKDCQNGDDNSNKQESKIVLKPPETGVIDLNVNFGGQLIKNEIMNSKKKPIETTLKKIHSQKKIGGLHQEEEIDLNVDFKTSIVESNNINLAKVDVLTAKKLTTTSDLRAPLPKRKTERAKQSALKYIEKHGPIQKIDPNSTRGSKKRTMVDAIDPEKEAKRQKMIQENEFYSEKFKKLMAMTSKNADLLELRDDEEKEKYFNKMEMKERMEEKMTSTYKVPCKAVRCLKCKYTSFSAADRCKTERHPLKVADATKRFFKCGDCDNRTVCLEVVPIKPCSNCGGGKWERTTMMKEKKVTVSHGLSIRGGEQKFVNSVVTDANINLLVPDE